MDFTLVSAVALLMAAATPENVSIPGPDGALSGTLLDPGDDAPAIILVAGSGPTDRDGNSPLGVKGGIYKQLAETLADKGVATIRFDKRGMFKSAPALKNPNQVTLSAYAEDVHNWAKLLTDRGKPCAWVAGHSEGGLVALKAAQSPQNLCGLILLASPGRPIGVLLREQMGRQLPESVMTEVEEVLVKLEAGERADVEGKPAPIPMLFNPAVQDFLIDLATNDPAELAGAIDLPMLIIHLEEDLQVVKADADALGNARADATRIDLDRVNHVFKTVAPGNALANQMSYSNAEMEIDPRVGEAIASFVKASR